MRTRDVVGRKIVALKQTRLWNENTGSWVVDFQWLELDNGTRLYPVPVEVPGDIATELCAVKRSK